MAIIAAILIAGGLIAAAIFFKDSGPTGGQALPPSSVGPTAKSTTKSSATGTCAAWRTAQFDLGQVTRMPPGWVYGNPGIDQIADSRAAQINTVLNVFESQISADPADAAAAARLFVAKQRVEVSKLNARQPIDNGDVAAVEGAGVALNRACGTG